MPGVFEIQAATGLIRTYDGSRCWSHDKSPGRDPLHTKAAKNMPRPPASHGAVHTPGDQACRGYPGSLRSTMIGR